MVKTRVLRHRDGSKEVFRVLSIQELAGWKTDDELGYERSIVWLEDPTKLPFVRVVEVRCARSRRGRLMLGGPERVVGYAKLMPDAPRNRSSQQFTRRLFYLTPQDVENPVPPANAIDPRTILPGIKGCPPGQSITTGNESLTESNGSARPTAKSV